MSSDDESPGIQPELFEVAGSVFTFYLQKSIPPPVKHWISMSILKNGGRVDILKSNMIRLYSDSLTPQFVLVEPGTSEEVVLRTKWQLFAEQYSLNIVSWTYVSACVLSKGILPIRDFIDAVPIFSRMVEEPGEPLRVLLHKSVDKRNVPDLQLKITKYGGRIVSEECDAQIIICSSEQYPTLISWYSDPCDLAVETIEWIDHCINAKSARLSLKPTLPETGPGGLWNEFTEEDDQHLVEYLAKRCPANIRHLFDPSWGIIYKELITLTKIYPWAARHASISWKRRYTMNKAMFDPRIEVQREGNTTRRRALKAASTSNSTITKLTPSRTSSTISWKLKSRPGPSDAGPSRDGVRYGAQSHAGAKYGRYGDIPMHPSEPHSQFEGSPSPGERGLRQRHGAGSGSTTYGKHKRKRPRDASPVDVVASRLSEGSNKIVASRCATKRSGTPTNEHDSTSRSGPPRPIPHLSRAASSSG